MIIAQITHCMTSRSHKKAMLQHLSLFSPCTRGLSKTKTRHRTLMQEQGVFIILNDQVVSDVSFSMASLLLDIHLLWCWGMQQGYLVSTLPSDFLNFSPTNA